MTRMKVDLKVGETLIIGDTKVSLEQKSGQLARLVIVAPDDMPIQPPGTRQRATEASTARKSALHIDKEHTHGEHAV